MRLICCGSGSSGNSYILTNDEESLILDCGVRFLEVKKALDFDIRSIKGTVVTHCHKDHSGFAHEYVKSGIPVWTPYTSERLRREMQFGGFKVQSFEAIHDVPCCGFLIHHQDIGKMLYVTDTEYVKYTFKDLSVMLIEANYADEFVNTSDAKYRHVLTGHMSLDTAMGCIAANSSKALNHIILCHLSSDNADPKIFRGSVKAIAPVGCTVDVAEKGLVVELGEVPF